MTWVEARTTAAEVRDDLMRHLKFKCNDVIDSSEFNRCSKSRLRKQVDELNGAKALASSVYGGMLPDDVMAKLSAAHKAAKAALEEATNKS